MTADLIGVGCAKTPGGDCVGVHVIKDGKEVEPIMVEHVVREITRLGEHVSKKKRVYEYTNTYYRVEDMDDADLVIYVMVSKSGEHNCDVEIKRPNPESIKKAMLIHNCPRIVEKLKRLGAI